MASRGQKSAKFAGLLACFQTSSSDATTEPSSAKKDDTKSVKVTIAAPSQEKQEEARKAEVATELEKSPSDAPSTVDYLST